MKKGAEKAANDLVKERYPTCDCALLSGSVVRGEATDTSDLDIVVFDQQGSHSYRESFYFEGWPVEIFVHNFESYHYFYEQDIERARPSLPRMVSEGKVIRGGAFAARLKKEADDLLEMGPKSWSDEEINWKRYIITDTLDDLIGSIDRAESLFIAQQLSYLVHEFILRMNHRWIGSSKWVVRALREFDHQIAESFIDAFEEFYRTNDKELVIKLVDSVLDPFGGRLFEGFSMGK